MGAEKSDEATYLSASRGKVSNTTDGVGVSAVVDRPINAFRAFPNPGQVCETEAEGFVTPTAVLL